MKSISFKRHRFPADVIRRAVWLYFRFSLTFRDVEEFLAQRGIDVSYETIRCWTIKFGPLIARRLAVSGPKLTRLGRGPLPDLRLSRAAFNLARLICQHREPA